MCSGWFPSNWLKEARLPMPYERLDFVEVSGYRWANDEWTMSWNMNRQPIW